LRLDEINSVLIVLQVSAKKTKKKASEEIKMKNVKCEQKDEEIVGVSSQDEECEDVTSDIQVFLLTMLNICKKNR
jgi:hypothetical protein